MRGDTQWKYVIDSENRRFELKFREVWQYRDLVLLLVKRDFASKYKQMRLGPLWSIINPVIYTVFFTIVFGNLAKLPTMDVPATGNVVVPTFLFYMIGNVLWSYFSSTVSGISRVFLQNAPIMGKVYYPRLVSPFATTLFGLIAEAISMILFAILLLIFSVQGSAVVHPGPLLLLFPLIIIQIMLLGMGVGLIVSAATTKYRDITMMVDFALRLGLYVTPVAYGLQFISEKWLPLFMLNPVTPIITTARYLCFGEGFFQIQYYLISWFISVLIFLFGVVLFNRAEKNFVDLV